jgi:hypothetical protein
MVLWLLAAVLIALSALGWATLHAGLMALLAALACALAIGRVYITRLQDRIIRGEMRLRAGGLLPPQDQALLEQLSMKQVAALRFASDAELAPLLARAVRERLRPDDIKRAVTAWRPDYDRT